ncbi:hypothetical protein Acr_28g0010550 [Actinidia rufa]|uniref:AT-hook motif nuclear-localized protein n=1 Tax=Actinidia rufa TaxID=165716 RepID=A0A7J0HB68_9ERIC|nr:hypothetical protein Acr_28g0010550 [Actinidia rufa]
MENNNISVPLPQNAESVPATALAADANGGEAAVDVVQKLSSVANCGPRSLCILSAVGAVSIGEIRPVGYFGSGPLPAIETNWHVCVSRNGWCKTQKGKLCVITGGVKRKIGKLCVILANPEGSVFGGAVAASLIADTPFQLIFASFNQNIKTQLLRRYAAESSTPTVTPGDSERE